MNPRAHQLSENESRVTDWKATQCPGVLHRGLDRAVQWRQLVVSPSDGVDFPQRAPREMNALRWRDIDLDTGLLAVVANSVRVTKGAPGLLQLTSPEPIRANRRPTAAGASWRCHHLPSMPSDGTGPSPR